MTTRRLATLALTVVLLAHCVASSATAAPGGAGTWRFGDLTHPARAAVQTDLTQVIPAARPLVHRLAGAVDFDSEVSYCRDAAESCSYAHQGTGGRWGIHLDAQTTSATYPANRFLVYHEIGHAAWALVLDAEHRRDFAEAVRDVLHGRPCINGLGRPCAPLEEVFADEFARYIGGFAASMTYYWTPPLFDPATFGALVGVPLVTGPTVHR
jgi:hypothetical protein